MPNCGYGEEVDAFRFGGNCEYPGLGKGTGGKEDGGGGGGGGASPGFARAKCLRNSGVKLLTLKGS
jgi:hypothetical protein